MDVRIYSCPFRTGWIYCDIRAQGEYVRTVHADSLSAYQQLLHLNKSGVNIQVDIAGKNLKSLRQQYKAYIDQL